LLFHIVSLGCPKNKVDSERFAWVFKRAGWVETGDAEGADLVLLNTCAFIAPATEESVEYLSELVQWKSERSGRKLVLAGCLPGRYVDDGSGGLEDIDLVIGPEDWRALSSWLGLAPAVNALVSGSGTSRYLKIAEGCSNGCSYCTIPMIRGSFQPVSKETIIREADVIAGQGAREIGLVAQDSGNWNCNGTDLSDLTSELAGRHPDIWFRLYYLHPAHFPFGLERLFTELPNVVPYIDMPVQHASTAVLKRMGRKYSEHTLRSLMQRLDELPVDVAVRYTVITGYPGETDDDFKTLRNFLGDYRCGRHIAAFSWYSEEGTLEHARTIEKGDSVAPGRASERLASLSAVGDSLYSAWDQRLTGIVTQVVADEAETGHTKWDAPEVDSIVTFTNAVEPGTLISARIVESSGAVIVAEPLAE